jgi:hypothetical protein
MTPTDMPKTSEDVEAHLAIRLFSGLTRSIESMSYLRFIFKGIFSKVNLIQLIGFINEKEIQKK